MQGGDLNRRPFARRPISSGYFVSGDFKGGELRCSRPVSRSSTLEHTQLTVTVLQRAAMKQLSAKVFEFIFEYLHIYRPKMAIFAENNSKIASLMSCQRSDVRKTLKYS